MKIIQVPWASSVGSSWLVGQQFKQCLRKQNQTVCEATQKEVDIFAGLNFFSSFHTMSTHSSPELGKDSKCPICCEIWFYWLQPVKIIWLSGSDLTFPRVILCKHKCVCPLLILLSGTFTYQDQIGSDFFDLPLVFPKGEISASLGQLEWGCPIFNYNHFVSQDVLHAQTFGNVV